MLVKKYFGKTTRDALRQVREELGADALILSNRPLSSGGIEIMAVADNDVSALAHSLASAANARHSAAAAAAAGSTPMAANLSSDTPSPPTVPPVATASGRSAVMNSALARTYAVPVEPLDEPEPPTSSPRLPPITSSSTTIPVPQDMARMAAELSQKPDALHNNKEEEEHNTPPRPVPYRESVIGRYEERAAAERTPLSNQDIQAAANSIARQRERAEQNGELLTRSETLDPTQELLDTISDEIKMLRGILQGQMASLAWANFEDKEPLQAELFRQLLSAGMSPALCRQLIAKLPTHFTDEAALKWAKSALAHNIVTLSEQDDVVAKGGLYAFVGPTGVGKTTTVAKLAARCTIRHGADRVALITTDSYRIGAQDQLRLYGKILGVSVYSVQNEADLSLTLSDLGDKHHVVLIDAVGMGQRDSRVNGQTEMFTNSVARSGQSIQRILTLASNADGHTLEDVVRRYRGSGLAGCIISKLDEAVSAGPILDILIRHRLPLYYVTNGQRVPEDLHLPNAQFLVDRAFKSREAGPYSFKRDEYQMLQAAQAGWS